MFNSFGNWIGKKFLKIPTTEFHVGCDALRNPFKNLSIQQIRKHGEEAAKPIIEKLAVFKFTKIILSAIASTSLIGFIFPKANQKLTDIIITKRKELEKNEKIKSTVS